MISTVLKNFYCSLMTVFWIFTFIVFTGKIKGITVTKLFHSYYESVIVP